MSKKASNPPPPGAVRPPPPQPPPPPASSFSRKRCKHGWTSIMIVCENCAREAEPDNPFLNCQRNHCQRYYDRKRKEWACSAHYNCAKPGDANE